MKLWTFALEPRGSFDVAVFGSFLPSVRSVCWDPPKKRIVVGTLGAEIYEFSSDDGTNLHDGALVQGHCKWELWGLAVSRCVCPSGVGSARRCYVVSGLCCYARRHECTALLCSVS